MSNLEAPVDLERFTGLSWAEIEAAKTSLHMSTCPDLVWECPDCAAVLKSIRRIIAAVSPVLREDHLVDLSAAGRLLPEGATVKSEFVMRWYLADETFIEWGSSLLAGARDLADGPPVGAVRGEIRTRESWVGPWSVVEPVAVKEASDVD